LFLLLVWVLSTTRSGTAAASTQDDQEEPIGEGSDSFYHHLLEDLTEDLEELENHFLHRNAVPFIILFTVVAVLLLFLPTITYSRSFENNKSKGE
jgi:hypothetical protein